MSRANILDIVKLNGGDKEVGLIEENLQYAPDVAAFFMRDPIKGIKYSTVTRTAFPSVGFRQANQGVSAGKSASKKSEVECFIFGGRVEVDKAVAMAHEDGQEAFEMYEADGVAKNALLKLGAQIWYGTGTNGDANGFPGLKSVIAKSSTISVDAAGTTATTATSVYAVKFGIKDVCLVPGQGNVMKLGDFRDETIYDANSAPLPGRVADLVGWIGLQVGNVNCVGRILNVTADSGKTLSDALISQLLEKFPVGYTPDAFFMSRRSRGQLQRSRTVVINDVAGKRAGSNIENVPPPPTEAFGIPIVVTDSILNTDALE